MARLLEESLSYFPLNTDTDTSRKIQRLEGKFGLAGFALWIKILQRIYGGKGYYILWSEQEERMFAEDNLIETSFVSEVVSYCISLRLFSEHFYKVFGILTSERIQSQYIQSSHRRQKIFFHSDLILFNEEKIADSLMAKVKVLSGNPFLINADNNSINVYINQLTPTSVDGNGISAPKGKESIRKDRESNEPTPPFSFSDLESEVTALSTAPEFSKIFHNGHTPHSKAVEYSHLVKRFGYKDGAGRPVTRDTLGSWVYSLLSKEKK